MRWKVPFFQNNGNDDSNRMVEETYGFRSKQHPDQYKELETFGKDLCNIVRLSGTNEKRYPKSNSSPDVFIFANKTDNRYKASLEQYKKLLKENVKKTYKELTDRLEKPINFETKNIAKKLDLVETVECLTKNLHNSKDHKENFPCHFINSPKSEIGKVSKVKLEKINQARIKYLDIDQWKTQVVQ